MFYDDKNIDDIYLFLIKIIDVVLVKKYMVVKHATL